MAAHAEPAAAESLNAALLEIAAELSVAGRLRRLVEAARSLVGARYAALGIPDGEGGFAQFITAGLSDEEIAAIGPLPRTHGLLGALLETAASLRTPDIARHPSFRWWPEEHPRMRSFLGVPIVSSGTVTGAFYLADKHGAREFSAADQRAAELLAAHAAVAIETARQHERSRELTVVEERNRLARELHDAVTQRLFSATLVADAAATLAGGAPAELREQIDVLRALLADSLTEMRALVFELRPADVGADGLAEALRKHADVLRRVHGVAIDVAAVEPPLRPRAARDVYRIAQEALANALHHGAPRRVRVSLATRADVVELEVADDGRGFEPEAAAGGGRHLGLVSMRERAEGLGGTLELASRPGAGTVLRVRLPLARNRRR